MAILAGSCFIILSGCTSTEEKTMASEQNMMMPAQCMQEHNACSESCISRQYNGKQLQNCKTTCEVVKDSCARKGQ